MAPPNPFPTFTPLSSAGNVLAYGPSSTKLPRDAIQNSPDLVVLITWMDAQPKHILKYTTAYQSSYPSASLLLITNTATDLLIRTASTQKKRLAPAVDHIRTFKKSNPASKILLHIMSNGGSYQAIMLSQAYKAMTGDELPIDAMALDSTPGRGTFQSGVNAFVLSIPKSFRMFALPFIYLIMTIYWISSNILRQKNALNHVREGLVNEEFFSKSIPRVYMYSKADQLVSYRDIEDGAEEAVNAGYRVDRAQFDGSAHVTHMMKDPDRYWGAVNGLLKNAA